ncbi:MAG TPA: hypothetical protein VMP01_27605 [Pirellulaceae bacterium]|nr:hypothetical protein [Pirellulaceae bacterium]
MASLYQFSIRGLLWAVTILAVGMAALLNANGLWQGLSWGLVLYALTASILLVVYRRSEQRAFWVGFSVFGWAYLLLFLTSQYPTLPFSQSPHRKDPFREKELLATQLAQWSHENLLPESRRVAEIQVTLPADASMNGMPGNPGGGDMGGMMEGMGAGGMMPGAGGMMPGSGMPGMGGMMTGMGPMGGVAMAPNPSYVPLEYFQQIFHALALLLAAAIGGKTCQVIYRTRPHTEE